MMNFDTRYQPPNYNNGNANYRYENKYSGHKHNIENRYNGNRFDNRYDNRQNRFKRPRYDDRSDFGSSNEIKFFKDEEYVCANKISTDDMHENWGETQTGPNVKRDDNEETETCQDFEQEKWGETQVGSNINLEKSKEVDVLEGFNHEEETENWGEEKDRCEETIDDNQSTGVSMWHDSQQDSQKTEKITQRNRIRKKISMHSLMKK